MIKILLTEDDAKDILDSLAYAKNNAKDNRFEIFYRIYLIVNDQIVDHNETTKTNE